MGESARRRKGALSWRAVACVAALAVQFSLVPMAAGERTAVQATASERSGGVQKIAIVLARELRDLPAPLSLLDFPPPDDGIAGARLAINDNNTTGRFLKQEFTLDVVQSASVPELIAEVGKRVDAGAGFVVADASAETVLALADALKGREALVMNAGSGDDRLREADCRPNLVHTAPSYSM
ncbi:MAG TPA: branched-chain amino acid ABC transporter substrate-binding protein, partial [Hyphomicrobiaceae bacterium]